MFDLEDNLDNPNNPGADQLDVTTLFNKVQADFAQFYELANVRAMEVTRMVALTGGDTYERAYQGQDMDAIWERAYQDVLVQIKTLQGRTDGTLFTIHSGASRVLEAYVMLTLVDLFGDVPYSEALKGTDGASAYNPKSDRGADIYAAAIKRLDEAVTLLGTAGGVAVARDIYYAGNAARWTALANTLKLKAYMNLRLINTAGAKTEIEKLLAADLIDTDAEEFTYKYGSAANPARSRHPWYLRQYQPTAGSADDWIGTYYMWVSYKDPVKDSIENPRWRYYFNRQVGSRARALALEPNSLPCRNSPPPPHYAGVQPFCAFDPGFLGRDHGNADGIPPDDGYKTCWGVYPCGGASDTNKDNLNFNKTTAAGQGANGAGIEPIWMASFTEFVKAEAYLELGITGDAAAAVESGVKKSIARVRAFATTKGQALPAGLEADETAYVNKVKDVYAASSDKLNIAMREYYIALFGNGIEAYNMYRRTGKPAGIQPMRAANPGLFLHTLVYPSDYVNLNSSATQKNETAHNPVFWDNHPADFVK